MFSDPEKNIEQFSLGKGNYVADLGSGAGFYTFAAAEAVGEDGCVYAIDVQKDLLQKIKKEAQLKHLKNIEIVWADLEHIGGTKLRDFSMDAIVMSNVLFQLKQKDNTISEIKRILKRGGRILLVDWLSSFGGMGPQMSDVLTQEEAKKLFLRQGFTLDREIAAGAQHYGMIFRKS